MSSQWVNKFAIMRDLSMVQGCIPEDVAGTVIADQKPPSQNIIEETEVEFYRNWVGGGGDFSTPDVGLIKHMLNVVRDYDGTSDSEDEAKKVIEITKVKNFNLVTPELKPISAKGFGDTIQKSTQNATKAKPKVKKQRNMAIESLLQNLQSSSDNINHEKGKLLKPTDFTANKAEATKGNISQAINKVTGWLDTQDQQNKKEKKKKLLSVNMTLDPSTMFKRKEHPLTVTKPLFEPIASEKPPTNGYQEYVPSSKAAEYYKKFLECSRMKQILQEDVWSRAERQMKEIDEQRKNEAELFALSIALSKSTMESPSGQTISPIPENLSKLELEAVRLPSHRHDLPGPCIVCSVRNKETIVNNINNNSENWREQNEQLSETKQDVDNKQSKSWRTRLDDMECLSDSD